jgi:hypothetical protein
MRRSPELALTPALSRKQERENGARAKRFSALSLAEERERENGARAKCFSALSFAEERERENGARAKCFSALPLAGEGRVRASVVQRRPSASA